MDTIYQGTHYRELPLMYGHPKCRDGFIEEMLEQNYRLLHYHLAKPGNNKMLVVRVDLHFDPYVMNIPKDNKMFQWFIGEYGRYLKYHGINYGYFWTRERDLFPCPGMEENPFIDRAYPNRNHHYHMYFIFPYKQVKRFRFSNAGHDLRLKEYWEQAIQFVRRGDIKPPVWFPDNAEMILTRETLPEIYERISYLCKVFSKETDLAFKVKRCRPSDIPTDFMSTCKADRSTQFLASYSLP